MIVVPPDRERLIRALTYSAYRAALKDALFLPLATTVTHSPAESGI